MEDQPHTVPSRLILDDTAHYADLWRLGLNGAGVVVAVPDTGLTFDSLRKIREETAGHESGPPFGSVDTLLLIPDVPGDSRTNRDHAHAVIHRILSVAPGASIIDLPVFLPTCKQADLLRAFDLTLAHGADVLNLSLGMPLQVESVPLRADALTLLPLSRKQVPKTMILPASHRGCRICERATSLVEDHDTVVIAATGNWADEALGCPSVAHRVLSVGSAVITPQLAQPERQLQDLLSNRSSTSYAVAVSSGELALLRSAFPGITATSWDTIIRALSGSLLGTGSEGYVLPTDVFNFVLAIAGGEYLTRAEWSILYRLGITTRRRLLTAVPSATDPALLDIADLITRQCERSERFVGAMKSIARAGAARIDPSALSETIHLYRQATDELLRLDFPRIAAEALVEFASFLCSYSYLDKRLVDADPTTADEVYQATTRALSMLKRVRHPSRIGTLGRALSWRARAITFLAEANPTLSDTAVEEAARAVAVSSCMPPGHVRSLDLGRAHLHLARAYFLRARHRLRDPVDDFGSAKSNAEIAIGLAGDLDDYTRSEAELLLGA